MNAIFRKRMMLQTGINGPHGKGMKRSTSVHGKEVKGRGHRRPKLDWRRGGGIVLESLASSRFSVFITSSRTLFHAGRTQQSK